MLHHLYPTDSACGYDEGMRLIYLLTLLLCLSGYSAEKESEIRPPVLSLKDEVAFREHFKLIMNQIKSADKPVNANAPLDTIDAAIAVVSQQMPKHKINCCMEYQGWFFFSTTGLAKDVDINDVGNFRILFLSGFAVRKGEAKVYSFSFW
jgi:hypothetical protein